MARARVEFSHSPPNKERTPHWNAKSGSVFIGENTWSDCATAAVCLSETHKRNYVHHFFIRPSASLGKTVGDMTATTTFCTLISSSRCVSMDQISNVWDLELNTHSCSLQPPTQNIELIPISLSLSRVYLLPSSSI